MGGTVRSETATKTTASSTNARFTLDSWHATRWLYRALRCRPRRHITQTTHTHILHGIRRIYCTCTTQLLFAESLPWQPFTVHTIPYSQTQLKNAIFFLSGNFLFGCWSEKKSKSAHLYEGEMQSCIICILNVEYWMKYERFKFETDRSFDDRDIRNVLNWCSYICCSLPLCPKWTDMEMAPLFRITDIRCRQFRCSPYTVTSNQRSIAHWCWPHTSYSIWVEDTRIVARNSKRIGKL